METTVFSKPVDVEIDEIKDKLNTVQFPNGSVSDLETNIANYVHGQMELNGVRNVRVYVNAASGKFETGTYIGILVKTYAYSNSSSNAYLRLTKNGSSLCIDGHLQSSGAWYWSTISDVTQPKLLHAQSTVVDFNPTSAGASGYKTATLPVSMSDKTIIGWRLATANISSSNGLQCNIVHVGGTTVYINYYAPKAITATVNVYAHVYYT